MTRTALQNTEDKQRAAADPASSAWVAANAGSGKTKVLIDRVTRLLFAGAAPAKILCITFTKAAAAEMASRLFKRLGAWALSDDDALAAELNKLEGTDTPYSKARLADARRLFAKALETPGGLKIQTIHAFCETVLARFPLEAGVQPHFRVLEEDEAAARLDAAIARLAEDVADTPDGALAKALTAFASAVGEHGALERLGALGGRRMALEAALAGGAEAAAARLAEELRIEADKTEAEIAADYVRGANQARLKAAAETLRQGSKTDRDKRAPAVAAFLAEDDALAAMDALAPALLTQKGEPAKKVADKASAEADPGLVDVLTAEQDRLLAAREALKARRCYDATRAYFTLAAYVLEAYKEEKAWDGGLDYEDLIAKTRALLSTRAASAWVLYKLDGGLQHILIDEAQDTSPEQWDVVTGPLEEFFAGQGAYGETEEGPRTIFAVGDDKQSIYSFQGADVDMFGEMQGRLNDIVVAAGETFKAQSLTLSFRSAPEVLSAVDAIFAAEDAAAGLTALEGDIAHIANRIGDHGRVELWPAAAPPEAEPARAWDAPLDQMAESYPRTVLAARIAEMIAGWRADKELLISKGRPIEPSDVMILVRRRDAFFEEMIRQLKLNGVPVAGADRLALTEDLAVMDLLAVARFCLLPSDDLSLAEALKSPLIGFDDAALYDLAHGRRGGLWSALQARAGERPDFAAAHGLLSEALARADRVSPFAFFSRLADSPLGAGLTGRQRLLARLGAPAGEPLDEFLSLALDYERRHAPSLQGFVDWAERNRAEIKRESESGRNEVRVMTVHGSKGLEAEIVFLPDTCQTPAPRGGARELTLAGGAIALAPKAADQPAPVAEARAEEKQKEMEEYRRLLYVAATRAKDRLYICGYETRRGVAAGSWRDLAERALGPISDPIKLPWGETGLRLEGAQTAPAAPPEDAAEAAIAAPPAWRAAPAPAEPTQPLSLAPSRLADLTETDAPADQPARSPVGAEQKDRFQRGRLLHTLLELLPNLPEDERAAAAARYLAAPAHGLAPETVAAWRDETLAVLDHPDFAPVFTANGRAEVVVAGQPEGLPPINGQIDRLIVTEGEVLIVDYKTNRPPPARAEGTAPAYLAQMAAYRALLAEIYPGKPIRAALLWTYAPRLMVLPDALLDHALASLKRVS
ncbi:MAG: double-strand break repair helicase AddA [Pseudomonadota bacterium]